MLARSLTEVNRRRTKQENVSVEFEAGLRTQQFGTTWGHFLASADEIMALTGSGRVVLEPIPIELDADSEGSSSSPAASQGS